MIDSTVADLIESAYCVPTPSGVAPSSYSIRALLIHHGFDVAAVSTAGKGQSRWYLRCTKIRSHRYSRSRDMRRAFKRADLAYFGQCSKVSG